MTKARVERPTFDRAQQRALGRLGLTEAQVRRIEDAALHARELLHGRAPAAEVREQLRAIEIAAWAVVKALKPVLRVATPITAEAGWLLNLCLRADAPNPDFEPKERSVARLQASLSDAMRLHEAAVRARKAVPLRRRDSDTTSPILIALLVSAVAGRAVAELAPAVTRKETSSFVKLAKIFGSLVFGTAINPDRAIKAYLEHTRAREGEAESVDE